MFRQAFIRLIFGLAASYVKGFPDTLRHLAKRKTIEAPSHVPAGVAVLQPPRQDLIQRRA